MGTVCPLCAICLSMMYTQMGKGTQIFPRDPLEIHFPVISLNHFSVCFSSQAGFPLQASWLFLIIFIASLGLGLHLPSSSYWDLRSQARASFV